MFDDRRGRALASFTFCFVSNSVLERLCSSAWKNQHLQKFCLHAPRNRRSPVPKLPYCSLHVLSLCPCRAAPQSTTMGSDLSCMHSTSSLKVICRPLHPPLLMGFSSVFTLSFKHCIFAGILAKCLLLAPIPRPATSTCGVPLAPLLSFAHR